MTTYNLSNPNFSNFISAILCLLALGLPAASVIIIVAPLGSTPNYYVRSIYTF